MKLHVLLAAAALAACSTAPADLPPPQLPQRAGVDPIVAARAAGVAFRAVGSEPAFVLQIYREDRIVLALGATEEAFPKPEPLYPRWNGEIYETRNERHRLNIAIRRDRPCPTQAGEHLVIVRLDDAEMTGCGRDL